MLSFFTHRNSPFSASGAWTTLTYESQRGGSYNLIDLSTGIFTAPVSGVFEFQFQGMDVSLLLFPSLSLEKMIHFLINSNKYDKTHPKH